MKSKIPIQVLALLAAFVGQFVSEGVMLSFPVLYPDLVEYFHATNAQISAVGSLTYGCWFLIGPISGRLVDQFGPVIVMMASGSIGALGCLLTMWATELWHVMITFGVIFGSSCGLAFIPSITVVGQYFSKHHHLATTFATVGGAVGGVVYPLCMQAVLHSYPWQWCFAATAYVMMQVVVCGAVFMVKVPEHQVPEKQVPAQVPAQQVPEHQDHVQAPDEVQALDVLVPCDAQVPTDVQVPDAQALVPAHPHWRRNLILFATHNFFWNFGDFGFMTMLPLFLSRNNFTTDDIAYLISTSMFTTILGRLAAAAYSAYPRGDRILIYNVSTLLSGLCIWSFCIVENSVSMWGFYMGAIGVYGFGFGVQTALVPSVTIDLVGHERTNTALGVAIFASGLAGLTSPLAAGLLTDYCGGDYYVSFRIAGGVVVGCVLLMLRLHWPLDRVKLR